MINMYDDDYKYRSSSKYKDFLSGWLRLIFSDQNSRNLFLFLLLNFSFAFVELFYGMWTNSLGLISDSFHMFFDCTALIAGLVASVIMKWKANEKFSFGYVRAEILAGFVNGLFLVFVAFFIFKEALERFFEPPEVKHDRLLIISILGLLVNLVGIFVFQHGGAHGHSHGGGGGGHGHSHSHGGHSHNHAEEHNSFVGQNNGDPFSFVSTNGVSMGNGHDHNHGHSHGGGGGHGHSHSHGHSHGGIGGGSQIMKGVFLHILADTLGSVGVIISAFLMSQFGWMIADPICSMFIATMIMMSVYPLLRDSISVLMQRQPRELDEDLSRSYKKVMEIEGVLSIQEPHFWTLCSNSYCGSVKVEIRLGTDPRYVMSHVHNIFNQIGIKNVIVQIEYAHM